jgi:hypothetical protein
VKKNNLTNLLIFPCGAISAIEIYNSFKDEKNINTFLPLETVLDILGTTIIIKLVLLILIK